MKEGDIVKACLEYLALRGIMAWRNNTTGVYNQKTGGYFFHGKKGVSDIIGILPQKHASELFGNFLAVEVKMPKKKPTIEQEQFLKDINERGGVGICVHSVDELEDELYRFL